MMTPPATTPTDTLGRCPCGAHVPRAGFRDRTSYLEFRINGLCQACQDSVFLCTTAHHDARGRLPLRRAALVAHDDASVAVLPFLAVAEGPRIAWEARHLVRIGPRLAPLDPCEALAPMRETLSAHLVRLHDTPRPDDPTVRARLAGTELVVVLDHATRRRLATLPLAPGHRVVVLGEEVPWRERYGPSLATLESTWGADPAGHRSALRTCALVAWALEHRSRPDAPPVVHSLLARHAAAFANPPPAPPDAAP